MSQPKDTPAKSIRSHASMSSKRSSRSSTNMAAVEARAKAEAARARAMFAQKEMEMKVKQAELKVEETRLKGMLEALQRQQEAEAASAESNVYEAAASIADEGSINSVPQSTDHPFERTRKYIEDQYGRINKSSQDGGDLKRHAPFVHSELKQPVHNIEASHPDHQPHNSLPYDYNCNDGIPRPSQRLGVNSSPDAIRQTTPQCNSDMSDLVRFLARRDLLTGGQTRFNDTPGNYWAWKSSFTNTTQGLNLSASEELDLLTRWLGDESSEHAKRIRAVHINNPTMGLSRVWERLEECYGTPEVLENALFDKMERFPKISNRDHHQLRQLGDLLMEIDSAKCDGYLPGLLYLDTARGVAPIVEKLPFNLQEKWMSHGTKYKREHCVSFPPFNVFAAFIQNEAKMRNDPSFRPSVPTPITTSKVNKYPGRLGESRFPIAVHRTEVVNSEQENSEKLDGLNKECPIHRKPHPLNKCRGFREKSLEERRNYLKENNICFRCCASSTHQAKSCTAVIRCAECGSDKHIAALHAGSAPWKKVEAVASAINHGGERESASPDTTSTCTQVCGTDIGGRSCSKICLVWIYPKGQPDKRLRTYAILDDQSNRSLARSLIFDTFNVPNNPSPYTLKTCAGVSEAFGRRAGNFIVESIDGCSNLLLPTLIECNMLPDNRAEIPTPDAARYHPHLKGIAEEIPPLDSQAKILLLLGRDTIQAHKVQDQRNGPPNAPFAQRLALGWVIVGDVCLGGAHKPPNVNTFKTHILDNGRPTHFSPCQNNIRVKDNFNFQNYSTISRHGSRQESDIVEADDMGESVFNCTKADEKPALSIEERAFLQIMEREFHQDQTNSWVAPLPFRSPRQRLPNNKKQASQRLAAVCRTLKKRPEMKLHFIDFMQKIFDSGHAEPAPPLQKDEECWYLPFFGVYHPQKPEQIRVVFDSSAQHLGVSLNDVLLTGPNLNNSLLGVLIRFRQERVAVTTDVQQMFHCFLVREDHRNFLRFLWHRNNDMEDDVMEFRMRVHVFGNSPSPAVAIFGLRRASHKEENYGRKAKHFVERHFYVDDGLISLPSDEEAIDLLKKTQAMLAESNLKLHKIASNSVNVLKAFPKEDLAKGLKDLDLGAAFPPMQRSLGVSWDVATDMFTFQVSTTEKPYTRRGVLSIINILFDPLGFAAPVSIKGRALLREFTADALEWDAPLPEQKRKEWCEWKDSLKDLEYVKVPRMYTPISLSGATSRELYVFCDASTQAISAVSYVKVTNTTGESKVGFVFGKAKLAPQPEVTIPRLELCAAVLAVEIAEVIIEETDVEFSSVKFFTDSKVVLGYIRNESRRFYVYVSNRVQRIRKSTRPEQWKYVPTEMNPADHGSRSIPANTLMSSTWLKGPDFLLKPAQCESDPSTSYDLVTPESDVEVRPLATSCDTHVPEPALNPRRFESFSTWRSLVRTIARLTHIARSFKQENKGSCQGWHSCNRLGAKDLLQAKNVAIRSLQHEAFPELKCIKEGKDLPRQSPLSKLSPYLDDAGCLRVGGRLSQADLKSDERNPLIIPGRQHLTTLLIRHYHEQVQHQGRHITEGAVRSSGLWIVGGKQRISSFVHGCVTCRKLRWRTETQKMADLPVDRLSSDPPFSHVGVDVFGPWSVTSRRTRGGCANSKRWAVLFTCLSVRAIHIEVLESMETSSFINALRRFLSIRGPVKQLRSDCGTNFVGACKELGMIASHCNSPAVQEFLSDNECTWKFNPPHASHMGGSWERMIGVTRRIFDAMLMHTAPRQLTHEVLTTFMAEVTAIVNSRPLIPVSTDPDFPLILTPATLLTQKVGVPSSPPGNFNGDDLHKRQWRQVQSLSNTFWKRWKTDYLSTLQGRRKWHLERPNLKKGDLVLLKDVQLKRNHWPMAVVVQTFPSQDGRVRKVELKVATGGTCKTFLRPITETVLLLPSDKCKDGQ